MRVTGRIASGLWLAGLVWMLAFETAAAEQNTVTFDNRSGEPALVVLVGPTRSEVAVPNRMQRTVAALAGTYQIKVRYGSPGAYHYAKGEAFQVTQTSTARSAIMITLHKVVGGTYETSPTSQEDFEDARTPSTSGQGPSPPRTWTDVSGRQVAASLVDCDGRTVKLLVDGKTYAMPLARLAASDRAYVEAWQKARRTAQPESHARALRWHRIVLAVVDEATDRAIAEQAAASRKTGQPSPGDRQTWDLKALGNKPVSILAIQQKFGPADKKQMTRHTSPSGRVTTYDSYDFDGVIALETRRGRATIERIAAPSEICLAGLRSAAAAKLGTPPAVGQAPATIGPGRTPPSGP